MGVKKTKTQEFNNNYLVTGVGIFLAILIGVGGFISFQKSQLKQALYESLANQEKKTEITSVSVSPSPAPSPTTELTADWDTFVSFKGYQVKFPKVHRYEERAPGFYVFLEMYTDPIVQTFFIDERGEKTLAERKGWLVENLTNIQYVEIPVLEAQGFIVEGIVKQDFGQGLKVKGAYIDLNGKELIIGCDTNETCQEKVLDQILSTFKFTD